MQRLAGSRVDRVMPPMASTRLASLVLGGWLGIATLSRPAFAGDPGPAVVAPPPADAPAAAPATAAPPTPAAAAVPAAAPTPEVVDVGGSELSSYTDQGALVGSARALARNWIIMPEGAEVGGELHFLTSYGGGLGDGALHFTDVMVARAHARYALGGVAEIFGGVDVLPKQPSDTDELVWQGADLGVRIGVGARLAAWARIAGGPLLADAGYWGGADAGLMGRTSVDETIAFQGAIGGSVTPLFVADGDGTAWLAETVVRGDTILRAPNGVFAAWIGCALAVPVAHADAPAVPGGMDMDPQTRVDVHLGMVYAMVDSWDLFTELSWIDRGDRDAPATTLPMLEGGFDQRQILFGVTRRFDFTPHGNRQSAIAY